MATDLKAVVHVPAVSATLDGFSHTFLFHSDTAAGIPASFAALTTQIVAFYNTTASGSSVPLANYLNPDLDQNTNHAFIRYYNQTGHLNGRNAGSPVNVVTWSFTGGSPISQSNHEPAGLAAALSYRADYGFDIEFGTGARPRAQDRGRVYLPIGRGALAVDTGTGRSKLTSAFITDATHAGKALAQPVTVSGDVYQWRQWSRKKQLPQAIVEFWMDDEPDYQRRRADPNPGSKVFLSA